MASWKTEPGLRTSPLSRMSLPLCRMKIEDKMRIANSSSISSESLWDVPEPPTIESPDAPPTGEGATGAAGTAGTGAMGESPNGEPPAGGPAPPTRAFSARSTVRATPPVTSAVHPTRLVSCSEYFPTTSSNEEADLPTSSLIPLCGELAVAEGTWSFPESGIGSGGGAGSALGLAISSGACLALTGCSAGGADAAGSNNGGVAAVVPDSGAAPERTGVGVGSAGVVVVSGSGSLSPGPGSCSFAGTGVRTGSVVRSSTE